MPTNRLYPTEKQYPKFYDSVHDRAILSYSGEKRAVMIFISVVLGMMGLAGLLAALPH